LATLAQASSVLELAGRANASQLLSSRRSVRCSLLANDWLLECVSLVEESVLALSVHGNVIVFSASYLVEARLS